MSSPNQQSVSRNVPIWVQGAMWAVLLGLLLFFEGSRWLNAETRAKSLTEWLSGPYPDFLPYLPFVVLVPICWWGFRSSNPKSQRFKRIVLWLEGTAQNESSLVITWMAALSVCGVAFGMSWWIGTRFDNLPPAYHDEYSYLIQAETYLAGRWSNPGFEPMPELFDQMHVLNEGRFASRYFPAVGAWIAPFLALGNPWLGHQIAQALCALLIFWIGRELSNNGTGLLAGVLFAFSPGLLLFSNLLLAHHPTMLGLCLFLWGFLRAKRTSSISMFVIAGIGLSFAMLCRPMTAAGFGFPFGVVFLVWWFTGKGNWGTPSIATRFSDRSIRSIALGIPLVLGFLIVFWSNRQITGSYLVTPYQLYLDTYTPRHVYGFNNVIRGEQKLGPKVLEGYDRCWAKNLTPELAVKNVKARIANSLRWTLGIVPLTATLVIVLLTPSMGKREWLLIPAAVLSLHVAHIPYWFEGIMGWHYVFETAPLWILIMAEATRRLFVTWRATGHAAMCWCWAAMLLLAVVANHITLRPVWESSMDHAVAEVRYPRQLYAIFRTQIDQIRVDQPAIVFVIPDPADHSMDYVTNPASLSGEVLVARLKDKQQLNHARILFPDRVAILFDAATKHFNMVEGQ